MPQVSEEGMVFSKTYPKSEIAQAGANMAYELFLPWACLKLPGEQCHPVSPFPQGTPVKPTSPVQADTHHCRQVGSLLEQ
jgi:hypothetical protein